MTREELLAASHTALEGWPGLDLALVFGSVARGRAREGSDLDIAVLGAADPFAVASAVSSATGREVDVVQIARAPIPLLDSIVAHGVVVFERERGLGALFRSRALAMLETDRPWYERMQDAWLRRVAARGASG